MTSIRGQKKDEKIAIAMKCVFCQREVLLFYIQYHQWQYINSITNIHLVSIFTWCPYSLGVHFFRENWTPKNGHQVNTHFLAEKLGSVYILHCSHLGDDNKKKRNYSLSLYSHTLAKKISNRKSRKYYYYTVYRLLLVVSQSYLTMLVLILIVQSKSSWVQIQLKLSYTFSQESTPRHANASMPACQHA